MRRIFLILMVAVFVLCGCRYTQDPEEFAARELADTQPVDVAPLLAQKVVAVISPIVAEVLPTTLPAAVAGGRVTFAPPFRGHVGVATDEVTQTALFRIWANESWFRCVDPRPNVRTNDCEMLGRALLNRLRQGIAPTYLETMQLYSSKTFPNYEELRVAQGRSVRERPPRAAYISTLTGACDEPEGYFGTVPWERERPKCLRLYALAGEFLRGGGTTENPCEGRVDHWGARNLSGDMRRPLRYGWTLVDCGRTLNAPWQVPSLRYSRRWL